MQAVSIVFFKNYLKSEILNFLDAYTTSDLAYEWQKQNPIQLVKWSKEFINDGIELDSHELSTCDVTTSTGQYSCIRLALKFKKKDEDAPVIPYDDIYDNYDYSY